jgi:CDP-6-deoxy-D-xylo-4-hexulose-3-dehydrase
MRWPLMANNITRADRLAASNFFLEGSSSDLHDHILTQGPQIAAFEREFSEWLGVRYSVFVNSGSSANIMTMAAVRARYGEGEVIVPCVTWVSDIAAILHAGMRPVFVDIHPSTLGMDAHAVNQAITADTRAVFLTHCLGFNALSTVLRDTLEEREIPLIEDCCEALGATWGGAKVGRFGLASNFSFYYAHHLTTIEGGMVATDDPDLYQHLRRLRGHGLAREMSDATARAVIAAKHPDLDPQFIFCDAAWNFRSTEANAVIGRSQLKRLDANNQARASNLHLWLGALDAGRYWTQYREYGASSYALPLILHEKDTALLARVLNCLQANEVEYRRGTAGGGNQLRQPYLRHRYGENYAAFPVAEHVHFFGLYLGNYPSLPPASILDLCQKLNQV